MPQRFTYHKPSGTLGREEDNLAYICSENNLGSRSVTDFLFFL